MLNGYKIIDADSHVIEPPAMWGQYLEPKFREFAPSADMKIKGEPISQKISPQVQAEGNKQMMQAHPHAYLNRYNPESHVQSMTQMGIDVAFIYPNYGLWLFAIDSLPAEVMGAFVRAYNTWLYEEFCSYDPARLKGVAAVNQHDPEDMVKELHRMANSFWAACEDLDMAVGIHEGHWSRLPTTGADRFNTRFALHACSHPMEQMMALLALIEGGVLERHPQLRIGFLESGCGWLPYWLWRLDEEYQVTPWEVKDRVRLMPSEYFRRQCFIAVEPSEPYLSRLIDYIGSDNIIFGSDYPHMDHKPDIVSQVLKLEKDLAKETVEKILADNPTRFYGSV